MKKNQARKKYKAFRNKLSDLKIKKLSNQIFQQSLKLKIWNKDSKNNSLNLINKNILKKWGLDIIYIAHMPEYE